MIRSIRNLMREERSHFMILAKETMGLLESYQGIIADSGIRKWPVTNKARPLVSTLVSEEEKRELALQSALWLHLEKLEQILKRYRISEQTVQRFDILRRYRSHDDGLDSGAWLLSAFVEHDALLNWLAARPIWKDIRRRLSILRERALSPGERLSGNHNL